MTRIPTILFCAVMLAGCSVPPSPTPEADTPKVMATMPMPAAQSVAMAVKPHGPAQTVLWTIGNCSCFSNNSTGTISTNCWTNMSNFVLTFFQNAIPATSQTQSLVKTLWGTTNLRTWYIVASNINWRSTVTISNNKPQEFFRLE